MPTLFRDLHYAAAGIRRSPGFAAAATITLTLGIATTTAVYSIAYGALVRPLPYPAANRLIRVWEEYPGGSSPAGNRWLSNHTYFAWSASTRTLTGIGSYATYTHTVMFGPDSLRMSGASVSPSVFAMLGVAPARGRFFTADEGREGGHHVVVISDRMWRDRYGGDQSILEQSLVIDQTPHTIVGIAPPQLEFPDSAVEFWLPAAIPAATAESTRAFTALARLRPGRTTQQAEAEGTAIARVAPHPAASTEFFFGKGGPPIVHARALSSDMTAPIRPALLVLAVAVTFVLLMTCANVSNLFLSRGVARRREFAIRTAIGCSRARLVRHLLTESAVTAMAGGALGTIAAYVLVRSVPRLAPTQFPGLDAVRVDSSLVLIAVLASILAAVLSGLPAALSASRVDLNMAIRGGILANGRCRSNSLRWRRYALAVQSAFAVILLVGAGLLVRSFARLLDVNAGYTADHVVTASVHFPPSASIGRTSAFIDRVLVRVRNVPGVSAAGAGNMMPLTPVTEITTLPVPRREGDTPVLARALTYVITPGYAEALRIRLREGRLFTSADRWPGTRKMLVSEEFARQYLSGPAVGRRLAGLYREDKHVATEIIGVVADVLKDGNETAPQPAIYFLEGSPTDRIDSFVDLVVRTDEPAILATALRDIIRESDSAAAVDGIAPLETLVARSVSRLRLSMTALLGFAAMALVIASVGLAGIVGQTVLQRRREFGIRAAIGATRLDIARLVLQEGIAVTGAGTALGLALASWLTRYMRTTLFGVGPLDALTFMSAAGAVVATALLACAYPAFRAASVNPIAALRAE